MFDAAQDLTLPRSARHYSHSSGFSGFDHFVAEQKTDPSAFLDASVAGNTFFVDERFYLTAKINGTFSGRQDEEGEDPNNTKTNEI